MSKKMKARKDKQLTCPDCGSQSVTIHEGDIQPTCDDCGWTVDNIVHMQFEDNFGIEVDSFEEQYTLIINEQDDITYVSILGTNGRVLYQTSTETRFGSLQKAFTATALKRFT